MNILFVCTGNTCRSPMAKAIFSSQWPERAVVTSAGIFADNMAPAAGNAIKVLEENGIELKHQSKQLQLEDILEASYVFTMTAGHKMLLMDQHPGAADKIFTLKEFVNGRGGDLDVNDPFGGNLAEYQATFEELKDLINRLPGLMGK